MSRHDDGEWIWKSKKRRGRPPRNSVAATVKITMRLTTEECRNFREAAGKQPITLWLRDLGKLCAAGRLRVVDAG